MENDGLVTTLTMAKIYARQGYFDKAAVVYRRLLERTPDRPEFVQGLAAAEAELRRREPDRKARLEPLLQKWVRLLLAQRNLKRLKALHSPPERH